MEATETAAPCVQDFMTLEVLDVEPSALLVEVLLQFSACGISCVVVCEKGCPVGIITERDVAQVAANLVRGKGETRNTAGEVMAAPVTTVLTSEPIEQVISLAEGKSIRHLPVVNTDGRLAGLLTQTDLLRAQRTLRSIPPEPTLPTIHLRDIMQTDILSVQPEMRLAEVEEFFAKHHISGAPVLDESGVVVGMISKTNLTACRTVGSTARGDLPVSDVMTRQILAAQASDDVFRIAEEMQMAGAHRVLVYEEGRVAGIVTTMDMLAALIQLGPK